MVYITKPMLRFRNQAAVAKVKGLKNIHMLSWLQEKYNPRNFIEELHSKIIIFIFNWAFIISLRI